MQIVEAIETWDGNKCPTCYSKVSKHRVVTIKKDYVLIACYCGNYIKIKRDLVEEVTKETL